MNTPGLNATEYLMVAKSSQRLSASVRRLAASVNELEEAYRVINAAASSLPEISDVDNVIRQGLMQGILQRDMGNLCSSILILLEPVKHFVRILLQSAEQMVETCTAASFSAIGQEAMLHLVKAELIASIKLLRELEARILILDMD